MKAKRHMVEISDKNEELVTFAETIDFTELFDYIKAFVDVDCRFYQPEITTKRDRVCISFMSDNITAQTGLFAAILKFCYLHSVSNGVFKDEGSGEFIYWVHVHVRYEHRDGGSNGMNVLRARCIGDVWEFIHTGRR